MPWLSPAGYVALSKRVNPLREPGLPSLRLDDFLSTLSRLNPPPFFVQIGANDGVKNDDLSPFVRRYGWRGILVEPMPRFFATLRRNYGVRPGLVFENVGIADADGAMDFFSLPEEFTDPDWLQQIGTFDRRAIEFNLAGRPELIEKIRVTKIPAISLRTLLERNRVTKVDLLFIDAEGFENVILRQLCDMTLRPRYIVFEWGCMQRDVLQSLMDFLRHESYELFSCGGDVLAVYRRPPRAVSGGA